MTSLQQAWATLPARLKMLEPLQFSPHQWALVERLHVKFNDREVHTSLPMPIARFREAARKAIHEQARHLDDVETVYVDGDWLRENFVDGAPDAMANYARLYNDDVDEMMSVLVPPARYRKGVLGLRPVARLAGPLGRMIVRELERKPLAMALSVVGVGFALAIVIIGRFSRDSLDMLLDDVMARSR